jgi:hypothetical protein
VKLKPGQKTAKITMQQITVLKARALKLWRTDKGHAKDLGVALLKVRNAIGHGNFKLWWEKHNLSQARVSYCMRLALGKVAVAKAKRQSRENKQAKEASKFVTKKLNHLFVSCAGAGDEDALPTIHTDLREAVAVTIAQAFKLAGWEDRMTTAEVHKASDNLDHAITALFSVISRTTEPVNANAVGK